MNRPTRENTPDENLVTEIVKEIGALDKFKNYPIRTLVKRAEDLGPFLKNQKLETNQVRKFLDAVNRVKVKLNQDDTKENIFREIEAEIVLLKPKLAYAAARQKPAEPLSKIISTAIDKVGSVDDFQRLVQFIESIIAYHKSAGGR